VQEQRERPRPIFRNGETSLQILQSESVAEIQRRVVGYVAFGCQDIFSPVDLSFIPRKLVVLDLEKEKAILEISLSRTIPTLAQNQTVLEQRS